MVVVLAILTVAALIVADYFLVVRKRRVVTESAERALPGLTPLSEAIRRVPRGVFLQPTFTWSRILEDGELVLGVHPLLLGLVGAPYHIEPPEGGPHIRKGEPLLRVGRNGHFLTVRSPVTGRILEVNRAPSGETEWKGLQEPHGSWLCRIEPERVGAEVPKWAIADAAVDWTRSQYHRLREHLLRLPGGAGVGVALADGGEIPAGILAGLDAGAWRDIQKNFLDG